MIQAYAVMSRESANLQHSPPSWGLGAPKAYKFFQEDMAELEALCLSSLVNSLLRRLLCCIVVIGYIPTKKR